jgi:hypothetical protein
MSQSNRATQPQRHPAFPNPQAEIDRINQLSRFITVSRDQNYHNWLDARLKSGTCGVALAEPRCGLSESSQYYQQKQVRYARSVILLPAPIFYIRVPPGCNQRSFFITVLASLHRNLQAGSPDDLRNRLKATLRQYGVKLLILDDAHHLKLKAFLEVVQLFETMGISIVLSGTAALHQKLASDWRGLHNTFELEHRFPPLTRAEVSETVYRWTTESLGWTEESDVTYEDVLKNIDRASRGFSGPLFDLLRMFAVTAVEKGLARIDEATIQEVLGLNRRSE